MAKKLLASILALCLILSTMGTIAFADGAVTDDDLVGEDGAVVNVTTYDELLAALADEKADTIVMLNDITAVVSNALSNAYGKTGINIKYGDTLDGNGHTLELDVFDGTWDSAISTTGGTIKNLTINKGFRGIFINHNSTYSAPVILENVTIEGTTYTISCDQGKNQTLTATNCTFNGWTSFAATLGDATFTNCEFGEGNGYAYFRPYADTKLESCDFEEGYEMDATRAESELVACTYAGELITSENIAKLTGDNSENKVEVDDTAVANKVAYIPGVGGFDTLQAAFDAVGANQTVELLCNVELTDTLIVEDNAFGKNVTFDGNGYTISASEENFGESKYVIKFGDSTWCTGINVENLNLDAEYARFGIFFNGGYSSTMTNVTVTGDYYYWGVYFFGTHGGTVTDCDFVSMFTNGQIAEPLYINNSNIDYLIANNAAEKGVKVFIDDNSYIETLEVGGNSTYMVNSLDNVGTVITEEGPAIAKVNGVMYASLADAIDAANDSDTIDLMGNKVTLEGGVQLAIKKDITIENGVIDITNTVWTADSIFKVWGGTATDFVTLTLNNVDFVGDNYSSAYGVIYATEYGKAVINNCDFTLSNEKYGAGGVLKGNGVAQSAFDVTDSTFNLENPSRIIANATVNLNNVKIDAAVTDDTLVVGDMNNHAFRNLVGTVTDSNIHVDGFETGIKNTDGDLLINGTSVVKLENSAVADLVLDGVNVEVAETAKLYADTSDITDDASVAGNVIIIANTISVDFRDVTKNEGEKLYDIYLVGANAETINRLNSADLTFALNTEDKMAYEVIKVDDITVTTDADYAHRYMFNFNGKDDVADTANAIRIAQVKVTGYGTFSLAVNADKATNEVHATKIADNIVDTFVPGGLTLGKGELDIAADKDATNITIEVPTRKLTVNVDFPNVVIDNAADYQSMTVTISGGDLAEDIVEELGDGTNTNASYEVTADLTLNNAYTVTVSGAGYRTARYTVTMTDAKTLNFWNNVKDNTVEVEEGKASSAVTKNFLAGDIVADNNINIYDLSAVVSYFTQSAKANADYIKYDLNRDGVIDSKDVAYVLVSWGE